jgi:alkanesulfonate monooxygenase SsuD/methylene tetrahydromethanopterin reductase-like flavin-dependent oxidoreductase (luciferase family)
MAQAGSSGRGRRFAAKYADTIVVKARTLDYAGQYRRDVREIAAAEGRDPDSVKLLMMISPIIGATPAEAAAKLEFRRQDDMANAEQTLAKVSKIVDIDFSGFDLDAPLSTEGLSTQGTQVILDDFIQRNEGRTLREAAAIALAYNSDDTQLCGTPDQVADEMAAIMEVVGGDGFLLTGPTTRHYLAELADGLVPALQDRGLVRRSYATTTLREHLLEF